MILWEPTKQKLLERRVLRGAAAAAAEGRTSDQATDKAAPPVQPLLTQTWHREYRGIPEKRIYSTLPEGRTIKLNLRSRNIGQWRLTCHPVTGSLVKNTENVYWEFCGNLKTTT